MLLLALTLPCLAQVVHVANYSGSEFEGLTAAAGPGIVARWVPGGPGRWLFRLLPQEVSAENCPDMKYSPLAAL